MSNEVGIDFIGSRFAAELHAHALSKLRGVTREIVGVRSKMGRRPRSSRPTSA